MHVRPFYKKIAARGGVWLVLNVLLGKRNITLHAMRSPNMQKQKAVVPYYEQQPFDQWRGTRLALSMYAAALY